MKCLTVCRVEQRLDRLALRAKPHTGGHWQGYHLLASSPSFLLTFDRWPVCAAWVFWPHALNPIQEIVAEIRRQGPWFDRNSGADHIFVITGGWVLVAVCTSCTQSGRGREGSRRWEQQFGAPHRSQGCCRCGLMGNELNLIHNG